jgi:hypothetical protein
MLCKLKMMDPTFWDELTKKAVSDSVLPALAGAELESDDFADPLFEDDSDLLCNVIIANVFRSELGDVEATVDGDLVSTVMAESLDNEPVSVDVDSVTNNGQELGHGKRKRTENKLYMSFWRHDEDASDEE